MRQPFGVVGCITPCELPGRDPFLEDLPGDHGGQRRSPQARGGQRRLCALRFVEALEDAGLRQAW